MTKYEEACLPDKPSFKHTELITCQEEGCGKKRWIKPQDKWQVKRCRWCQDALQKSKTLKKLSLVKEKAQRKKLSTPRFYTPRLQVIKFLWLSEAEKSQAAKGLRRIWP